jgi:glutathione synthase
MWDQKAPEYMMFVLYRIRAVRRTFAEIYAKAYRDDRNRLILDGIEVSLVYYRTGYQQEQYYSPETGTWDEGKLTARTMMECSMAIKCPSIDLHIATLKKFQQTFSDHDEIVKLVGTECCDLDALKETFKGLYSLENLGKDGDSINEIVEKAIQNPKDYVLKPLKEGGGNNFFDEELKEKLIEAKGDPTGILSTYLIMDRINPPLVEAAFIKQGNLEMVDSLSEIGVFSAFLYDTHGDDTPLFKQSKYLLHENIGQLCRTKASHYNEGGVAAGYACMDVLLLVKDEDFREEDRNGKKVVPGTLKI